MLESTIRSAYEAARATYAAVGVDTEAAIAAMNAIPLSIHCWQGDDVTGLESVAGGTSGGIMSTGNYPGKARNGDELRADLDMALAQLPGSYKINIHASYAELDGEKTDRDAYAPRHFSAWMDWAKAGKQIGRAHV